MRTVDANADRKTVAQSSRYLLEILNVRRHHDGKLWPGANPLQRVRVSPLRRRGRIGYSEKRRECVARGTVNFIDHEPSATALNTSPRSDGRTFAPLKVALARGNP